MDTNALFCIQYGLYLISAKGEKDNACIVDALMQVTDKPPRLCVALNCTGYTHDMIAETGQFNVSVLEKETPVGLFARFGWKSGRESDKFAGQEGIARAENGIYYLKRYANAYYSAKVTDQIPLGTHTLFLADVTDAKVLSDKPSITYAYYREKLK